VILMPDSPLVPALLALWLALGSAAVSLLAGREPRLLRLIAVPLLGLAGVTALSAGFWTLIAGTNVGATLPLGLPWLPWHVRLDALAGVFLVLIGLVTARSDSMAATMCAISRADASR
jgi:hydrogenase-4 component B